MANAYNEKHNLPTSSTITTLIKQEDFFYSLDFDLKIYLGTVTGCSDAVHAVLTNTCVQLGVNQKLLEEIFAIPQLRTQLAVQPGLEREPTFLTAFNELSTTTLLSTAMSCTSSQPGDPTIRVTL